MSSHSLGNSLKPINDQKSVGLTYSNGKHE